MSDDLEQYDVLLERLTVTLRNCRGIIEGDRRAVWRITDILEVSKKAVTDLRDIVVAQRKEIEQLKRHVAVDERLVRRR